MNNKEIGLGLVEDIFTIKDRGKIACIMVFHGSGLLFGKDHPVTVIKRSLPFLKETPIGHEEPRSVIAFGLLFKDDTKIEIGDILMVER